MLNFLILGSSGKRISNQTDFDNLVIEPNDKIYFKKGQTFINNGLSLDQNNVSIGSFGTGNKPIITGSKSLPNVWTNDSGNLWKTTLDDSLKWVFLDGACAELAQIETTIATTPTADTLTVADSLPSGIAGAEIMMMKFIFRFEYQGTIQSYTGGTITTSTNHSGAPQYVGYSDKCIIYNHKDLLLSENQWYYDDVLNELWVYSTTDPNSKNFTYTTTNHGITVSGNNVAIRDIELNNYYRSAVYGDTVDNLLINLCDIKDIRTDGIHVTGLCNNSNIIENDFQDIGNNGVVLNGWQNSNINNNTGRRFGQQANVPIYWNYTEVYKTGGCFVAMCANNFTADPLTLSDTIILDGNVTTDHAYMGMLGVGDNLIMRNNDCRTAFTYFKDGGVFYIWGNYSTYAGVTCNNGLIEDNISRSIIDDGTPFGSNHNHGIYIDNGVTNALIQNNTIYKENSGNGTHDNSGEVNNTFTNNTEIEV
jgi:hypothetical protein